MQKTRRPSPRMAYSAALPVSPEVAPRMLSCSPRRPARTSNSWPSSCIAMSLKASVGPLDSASRGQASPAFSCGDDRLGAVTPGLGVGGVTALQVGRRDVVDVQRQDLERQPAYGSGRQRASVARRRPSGSAPGRYRPPSGARPSSRMSEKPRAVRSPRVERYFTSVQLFLADAHDRRQHRGQRLHLRQRLVHAPRPCRGSG